MIICSRILISVCLSICLIAGCSAGNGPKLVRADGTVKFQGKPLAAATVMFVPEKGPFAMGITDKDGRFQLATGTNRGVLIGPARVTVKASAPDSTENSAAGFKPPKTNEEREAYMKKASEMQQAMATRQVSTTRPSLIPEKYEKVETSGLTYTITASGPNHFDIELND